MKKLTGLVLISGSSQCNSDIRYLSGFSAPDPFIFLKTGVMNYLVVSTMEQGRAQRDAGPGTKVFTPQELGLTKKQSGNLARQISALTEKINIRHLRVPPDFPAGIYHALKRRGTAVSIVNAPLCPERMTKTKKEIAAIRSSQRAAIAAMHAAVQCIAQAHIGRGNQLRTGKEPLTSEYVRRLIHKVLIDRDCSACETIVAGGVQAADPNERGHGPLVAGQSIIIDIFPRCAATGYWGDLTRTVCRGPASPELKKLYNAVRAAQSAALRMIRPGVCADDVHAAARDVFEQRGYTTRKERGRHEGFIHGTGHGVGLEIHERPRIGGSGERLEAGHVVTVEPGLYYAGLGGIRIEDTIVVTEKGWRYLAACEKKFELR